MGIVLLFLRAKKTPGIGGITPGAKYTPDLGNRVLSYPAREEMRELTLNLTMRIQTERSQCMAH